MYNIFRRRVPDYSNLVIGKVKFNLLIINVSIGKVYCCYFDQRDYNGPYNIIYIYERQHRQGEFGGLSLFDESFPNEDATGASRSLQEGSTKPPWGWVRASRRDREAFAKPSRSPHPSPRRLRGAFLKASRGARGVFIWKRFVK